MDDTRMDDLLREASDPTTPAERLLALLDPRLVHARPVPRRADGLQPLRSSLALFDGYRTLRRTVLLNPACPFEALGPALRLSAMEDHVAWHNPSVPLVLMTEPLAAYEAGALSALRRWPCPLAPGVSLADLVHAWSVLVPATPEQHEGRVFARHLAGLFGLPWPTESPPTSESEPRLTTSAGPT